MKTITLAIETSCDDTSVGLISYEDGFFQVEKLLAFSQIDIHQQYGGVVPEIAYRSHADKIIRLIEELGGTALQEQIDFISVTSHPGLPGALVVGITVAHMLGNARSKPVHEVNHIMGHVFSVLVERTLEDLKMPYVCLTVSGGHNDVYIVERAGTIENNHHEDKGAAWHKRQHLAVDQSISIGPYTVTKRGQTIDDAAGEAYDKVSRLVGGPYPGGPWIDQMAAQGSEDPSIRLDLQYKDPENYNMSLSGLKSQVHYLIQELTVDGELSEKKRADIIWRFQEVVCHALVLQLERAANDYNARTLAIVGGVSANKRLQALATERLANNPDSNTVLLFPQKFVYCTDNAAMIGVVGHLMHGAGTLY